MSTTDAYAVPPDVWDAIVPEARATDARERRITGWVVLAAVALVVASFLGTRAGLFGPRVEVSSTGAQAEATTHTGTITLELRNTGRVGTRVVGADIRSELADRVRVTSVRLTPAPLAGGGTGTLTIGYVMADCAAYRAKYGEDADPDLGASDAFLVDATTWWGGTRQVDLDTMGPLGDVISGGCPRD